VLTKEDFIIQYENASDEELYQIYIKREDYTEEAKEAVELAINKRGGIEELEQRLLQRQTLKNEEERIIKETSKLYASGSDLGFIKKMITSEILTEENVNQIIRSKIAVLRMEEEDKKIKPRTVFGGLVGGVIASIVGGILWGLQMIQMHRIFLLLLVGLVLLSYGIIKLLTRQSKRNTVVLISTVISVIAALVIGRLLFEIFG
jgi:hypothetical protein